MLQTGTSKPALHLVHLRKDGDRWKGRRYSRAKALEEAHAGGTSWGALCEAAENGPLWDEVERVLEGAGWRLVLGDDVLNQLSWRMLQGYPARPWLRLVARSRRCGEHLIVVRARGAARRGRLKTTHGVRAATWKEALAQLLARLDADESLRLAAHATRAHRERGLHAIEWDGSETLLSVKEAAVTLGVHPQTVRSWIRAGYLPCLRVGPRRASVRVVPEVIRRLVKLRAAQHLD